MQNLSKCITSLITSLNPEVAAYATIANNNATYVAAVKEVWPAASAYQMVLQHTNAFYIRNDTTPRKGPDKDKPYIVCEICIDEPLIRSEMDARQELMKLTLMKHGLTFNELRIIPARRGMRKRHPFASYLT